MADSAAAKAGTSNSPSDVLARLDADRQAVERELEEIELLVKQARSEADRHEARRQAASERFDALLAEPAPGTSLRESHEQLMLQAQRASLMSTQIDVLEGKQKVLRRYASGITDALALLSGMRPDAVVKAPSAEASAPAPTREVLAAQEEMRRVIARQMHDGPAQSIANIALQAQVVQRLLARDPAAAERELGQLQVMVQHALEATKSFIFEVRPMVLDDLGLMPTLRRAAREHERRAGIPVRFESLGADHRLETGLESALFRIVDDATAAYLGARPAEVVIRLNWSEDRLAAIVRSRPPAGVGEPEKSVAPPAKPGADMPNALAEMLRQQAEGQTARAEARLRAYALPDGVWRELRSRAQSVGIELSVAEEGLRMEAVPTAAIGTSGGQD